ncbi:ABC transporter substrate-binding protein [Aliidongia dinghuensis]|uniref:ABC transporter substrate-binding protein n=1 Tax=Aliidongia dinghuensis TaxID=1867774 RepID=A0A8J2YSI2_9PROT|nr:iron ABC transporter permease [Aliidongia dinghuensis]GGF15560.1 ABC transporter substrate-binding protein [Aliidongia dinghuensis]
MTRRSLAPDLTGGDLAPVAKPAVATPAESAARPARRFVTLDPSTVIWVGATLLLVFMIVAPMARLLFSSFQSTETGQLTLENYVTAYGNLRRLVGLGNSLLYGAAVVLVATGFAVPLAWAVARTDMPAKGLVRATVLGAFITPSYLGAIGWILLAGPNAGWLNRLWMALTGAHAGIVNVYSFAGLVLVTALYAFPYIFVFTADALDRVSSEMEEAAHILGLSPFRTILRVTLPLVLPAILGGAIIVFLDTVALFGTPAVIALPARVNIMTLQLWQFFEFPVRAEAAAAYAVPLVLITIAMLALQRTILGRKGYVSLTGKGGGRSLMRLGRLRWAVLGFCFTVCALAVFLPYLALAQAAFSRAWGQGFSFANLTLGNFAYLFGEASSRQVILNTFIFSAATACLAVVLALIVAYVVGRRLVIGGGVLAGLCMAPLVVPGIVLAIGLYAVYSAPPLMLYGTAAILVLGFTTRFLPIAFANCTASLRSLNPEMEEAVRILGGSRFVAVRRVVVPLLKKSLIGTWLLVFIPASRELSTAIFLVAAKTRVISVMILDLSENGSFETLAALGFFLLGVTILIVLAGYRLVGRDFLLRKS